MRAEFNMITVFGSSGRLGRNVVAELLERDTSVRAFVHRNNPFDRHERLTVVTGDVHDADAVAAAVDGTDAVIATLGRADAPVKDVSSAATSHLISAMVLSGIRRIISVTGSAARDDLEIDREHPHLSARRQWMMSHNPELVLDGEHHMRLLRDSALDWTIIRAPRMVVGSAIYCRLVAEAPHPTTTLTYRAVAAVIVDQIADRTWQGYAPFAI